MKKLSDYKGEEAIELWANILDPVIEIVGDKEIAGMIRAKAPIIVVARKAIEEYRKEVSELLLAIDSTPLDGLNIVTRLASVINEIGNDEEIKSFFGLSAGKTGEIPSGSATENTEANESPDASSDI